MAVQVSWAIVHALPAPVQGNGSQSPCAKTPHVVPGQSALVEQNARHSPAVAVKSYASSLRGGR